MENNEIKNLAEILKAEELKKQLKYETLNKKALQAIEQKISIHLLKYMMIT